MGSFGCCLTPPLLEPFKRRFTRCFFGGDFLLGGGPFQGGKITSICWQVAECLTMHCPKCYCPLDPDPDGCVAMSCLACNEGCLSDASAFRWSVGWFTPGTLNNQIFMVVYQLDDEPNLYERKWLKLTISIHFFKWVFFRVPFRLILSNWSLRIGYLFRSPSELFDESHKRVSDWNLVIIDYITTRWWQLKYVWNFHPDPWGRWAHFDEHIFQRGWFNHQPD